MTSNTELYISSVRINRMTGSVKENTAHHHNNKLLILMSNNSPSRCGVIGVNEISKVVPFEKNESTLGVRGHLSLQYRGTF